MPDNAATTRKTSRRRRATRWALIVVGVGVAAVLLCAFVLTRSATLTRIVEPRLSNALGAPVTIGHASFHDHNTVVLRDVRAVAPGLDGPSAEVLVIPRLSATLDWSELLSRRFGVRAVEFDDPTIRLSRNSAGALNIDALRPTPGGGRRRLPKVTVRNATVEFGEHSASAYDTLASIEVDGELRRSPRTDDRYLVALVESEDSARARAPDNTIPITLSGEYDPVDVEGVLTLENVDLASWGPRAAPSDVREFWARLALAGRVAKTEFLYSKASGMEARFTFDNVGLTLPIAADPQAFLETSPGPMAEPERLMRISDASGVATIDARGVDAEITGLIEDLPYRVTVTSESVAVDTAFVINFETTEPFSIAQRPQLLPFAPQIVRDRFRSFSGPTAMLEASIVVARGAPTPDGPARLDISGAISFTDGIAAYESFPYQFNELAGRVRFDSESILIEEITGVAPSGATVAATGVIAPPTEGAQVVIDIRVEGVPLDQTFGAALPATRASLIDELFNREAESRLRERGLLTDEFDLGGVADLDIRVRRPLGLDTKWLWEAVMHLPRAGLLVERFPYPMIAENASVVVTEEFAEVRIPFIRGLAGGDGDLQGRVILEENDVPCFEPIIMIRAMGIPVDERLLAAVPGGGASPPDQSREGSTPHDILRQFGIRGTLDTISRVLPRDDDSIGFDVTLDFADLAASPVGAPSELVRDLTGKIEVSESGIIVHEMRARLGESDLAVSGEAGFGAQSVRPTSIEIAATALDLSAPFERLIAPFAPDAADAIRDGMNTAAVEGTLDVVANVSRERPGAPIAIDAESPRLERVAFTALGGRVSLSDVRGVASIHASASGARIATFTDFAAQASFAGSAPSAVSLNGDFDLLALESTLPDASAESRTLFAATSLEWPSTFADAILERASPGRARRVRAFLDRWGLALSADLSAEFRSSPGVLTVREVIATPNRLVIARDGAAATLDVESGSIVFRGDDNAIEINGLMVRAESFHASLNGDALLRASPSLNLTVSGAIAPFDASVQQLLPDDLKSAMRASSISATSLAFDDARVAIASETAIDATIHYAGLTFDVGGTSVSEMSGSLGVRTDTADPRPLDATLKFDAARVQRIRLGAGETRLVFLDDGETLVVPYFDADAYGGRVFGVAKLEGVRAPFLARDASQPTIYEVEGTLSGVSFDRLRRDLRVDDPDAAAAAELDQGGAIDALLAIAGVVGQPENRVGRGSVRVWGGTLLRIPLASRLIELSNLQAPTGQQIDYANAAFFVEGDTVHFEQLNAASRSVNLDAAGTMRWPSLELDLRVTSRGSRRTPILSDIIESFRNELVVSRVRGPLNDPTIAVETLPVTRRFLDSIFGRPNDRPDPARPAARTVRDTNPRAVQ